MENEQDTLTAPHAPYNHSGFLSPPYAEWKEAGDQLARQGLDVLCVRMVLMTIYSREATSCLI